MRTFTVVDRNMKAIAYGKEIGNNTFRVYLSQYEGGYRDFTVLSELFEATGGCALQNELFPNPIPVTQLNLFPKDDITQNEGGRDE